MRTNKNRHYSVNLAKFRWPCSLDNLLKRNFQNMHELRRRSLAFYGMVVQFVYVEWIKRNIAAYLKTNSKLKSPVTAITCLCSHTK